MARRRDRDDRDDEGDGDDTPATPSDAYVGLIGLATAALIGAAVFLYLDHDAIGSQNPQPPAVAGAPEGLAPPGAAGGK
jgi:hypothetical protein